jgi:hypothetical protein
MDISDCMLRSPSKSLRNLTQEKDIELTTTHKALREKLNLFPYKVTKPVRRSWTSLPTPFIRAQRHSERNVSGPLSTKFDLSYI